MRKTHDVEILFTILLFTIFVMGSFFILANGASGYKNIVRSYQSQDDLRLALSYFTTRFHQAPSLANVKVVEMEGVTCIVIEEELNEKTYATAIYHKEGGIYEIFMEKEQLNLSYASKIMDLADLQMIQKENQLEITAINKEGEQRTLMMELK